MTAENTPLFPDLSGKVAVITGAGGVICGSIAEALAAQGTEVAIWDICEDAGRKTADVIHHAGGRAVAVACDATDAASVGAAVEETLQEYSTIDILINGAGGSRKEATTSPDLSFFDVLPESIRRTVDLNYLSAVIPSQAVGRILADQGKGVILNIASIAGVSPLTRAIGYSNSKAAVINFTQWLAVHMARQYSPNIRVNAMAPGFVLTEQNRFLLVDEKTGEPTERGEQIIRQVPMGRWGKPEEMVSGALWLTSDASAFVTGAVVPIDGGFTAYSGV